MGEVAAALMARRVAPGDRVALWAPNSARWVVAALGVMAAGAVVVPINTRFKGPEVAYILRRTGARLLLAGKEAGGHPLVPRLGAERPGLGDLDVVVIDQEAGEEGSWEEFKALGATVPEAEVREREALVEPGWLSDLIFTSGTTGQPKGVMLTHGQSVAVYRSWTELVGLGQGDRYLVAYPFFHTAGSKSGWLSCLLRGATALPQAVFDAEEILSTVERHHVTVLPGTPTMLQDLLSSPQRRHHDTSSLRLTVTGAAVVPVELVRQLRDDMGFTTVVTGYGLTETCGTAAMCSHDDDLETVARWSGRALPGTELAIVDETGRKLSAGHSGEVVTRGYHVTCGYFEDPEATAAAIDPQGWLHTGDIGVMDERGYVAITDRKKDMFIVGGFNAYPAEIEAVLRRHEALAQAAVVGVADRRLGEVGFAFVVPEAGRVVEPSDVIAWCRDQMANFKVPRHVAVVDALPLNATGKVDKPELRRRAQALRAEDAGALR